MYIWNSRKDFCNVRIIMKTLFITILFISGTISLMSMFDKENCTWFLEYILRNGRLGNFFHSILKRTFSFHSGLSTQNHRIFFSFVALSRLNPAIHFISECNGSSLLFCLSLTNRIASSWNRTFEILIVICTRQCSAYMQCSWCDLRIFQGKQEALKYSAMSFVINLI